MRRATLDEPRIEGNLDQQILTLSSPLADEADLDPLLARIGDARFVLLGEASHGTHDYYLWRARISRRLIEEKGFRFIAVEGDWPDCYRVNRYVHGELPDQNAEQVLRAFARWPTWMWANWEIVALSEWMRRRNADRPDDERAGFYGLDVYSLWESLYALIGYLKENVPEAVPAAYEAFRCFAPYGEDPQAYAYATRLVPASCEREVIDLLRTVREQTAKDAETNAKDLDALMNAEAVSGAETYYRTMITGGSTSWNVRDRHMSETLNRLIRFYGDDAKAIVWEHNTHIGDARYTDMAAAGMFNVGELVREEHESDGVVLAGFGSYQGTVIAGRQWDAPMEVMDVPPAQAGSWEHALHQMNAEDRLLLFHRPAEPSDALAVPRGQRAIGVVYDPAREWGNYVPTVLPLRYDAFLYLDRTEALHPLHITPEAAPP
ncbi:MAG TPA: erythromycin esterase family protein, partial [Thermomicrobiales bacterium]|nr:erythromycin esterase family protein [Thermomicrobiales bacterium]